MSGTSPRKLVLVGPSPPYRGGIAHFQSALARTFRQRGYSVKEVSFSRQYPNFLFPGHSQFAPTSTLSNAQPLIDSINPITYFKTAQYIAKEQPQATLFQYWMPFFAPAFGTIARLLRRKGIPSYAIVHNALPHEPQPFARTLSRFFFHSCAGSVVLSPAEARLFKRLCPSCPLKQAHHPIYDIFGEAMPPALARQQLGLPLDSPVLLFFGLIRSYKGLDTLLQALPRVLQALPTARLLIAGEFYDTPEKYYALIENHKLKAHVQIHAEYIPDEEVSLYFSAADLVVQPYHSATQSGVVPMAYYFERPVIVTQVGGLPEMVHHEQTGFVVPPRDASALAEAIIRFFREDWAERLKTGIQTIKKQYSWDALAHTLESFWTQHAV